VPSPVVDDLPPSPGEAERRQLTVMFSDLIGSTELSAQLDPEDLRDLNRAYQVAVTAAIERFGGYVARYMGDGVLAYFGYPLAHENDAERAVRAALEIVDAVPRLDTTVTLAVRVGIATGLVVVGDIIGDGAAQESAVVGKTPNLAARLEGFAGPNQVVIGEVTHRLVAGRFRFESLGNPQLKGLDDAGEVFRVLDVRDGARVDAGLAHGRTPLVGRAEELEMLARRWQLAGDGEGQVVLLGGEPGIGKSRIVHAFRQRIDAQVGESIRFHCSSFGINQAFHPVIDHLEHVAGLTHDGDSGEREERLKEWLGASAEVMETAVPLLGKLLSIATASYPPLDMVPQVQKDATIALLVEQLTRSAASGPTLIVVEDAQWMDPSTAELLDAMAEAVAATSVLILVTHRPEFDLPWRGRGHVTSLSLNRLGKRDVVRFVASVAGSKPLPDEIVAAIAEKADGTPLFIEEITRSLLETGVVRDTGSGYEIDRSVYAMAVPSTLQDSLMARLDQLGPAKEIAQIAAVFGRTFSVDFLARLAGLDLDSLESGLSRLVQAGLLSRHGTGAQVSYVFRQALVQDAAYSSLLIARRRALHDKAVEVLEQTPLEHASRQQQLLAYHCEQAGHWRDAFSHLCRAAEEQAKDYALQEASRLYEHALRCAEQNDSGVPPDRLGSALLRAAELMFTRGRFADAIDLASRACVLAGDIGDASAEAAALLSMAYSSMWLEDFDTAHKHAARAQALAEQAGIAGALAGGAMLRGYTFALAGQLDEAQVELERSIAIGRQSNEQAYLAPTYFMVANLKNWAGQFDAAIAIANQGREIALSQQQIAAYVRCHWARGTALIGKGEYDAGARDLREGLAQAEKMGDMAFIPRFLNTLGWMFNECHAYENAIEHCQRAVEIDGGNAHATGVERIVFSQLNWADALLGLGDLQGAKEMLDTVYAVAANPRTHEWMRWRYSTHMFASFAQYWVTAGDPRQAGEWASRCLAIAQDKGSWKYIAKGRRLVGAIATHAKDWDSAAESLMEAESIAKRIGHVNEVWRVHAEFGDLQQAMGKPGAGSEHRQAARAILVESRESIKDKELSGIYASAGAARVLLQN